MGRYSDITSSDGFILGAYEAEPDGQAKGAIVVIQEIFGVNPHIRDVVDGYAAKGYFAVAPKIFDRAEPEIELGYDEAGMNRGVELAFQQLEMSNTLADIQAAIHHAAQHGKVGVVGYCFGGLLTYLSACNIEGVAAASSYYGGGIASVLDQAPKCPLIMHFGELDAHIPMSDVEKIQSAHPDVPVFVYAADHGFNCNHRASFDEAASTAAVSRTLAHFADHL